MLRVRKARKVKIKVTAHARKRLSERTGAHEGDHASMADSAWRNGLRPSQLKGPLHDFLMSKQPKGDRVSIRVLGDFAYVFDNRNGRLITAYAIPERFLPVADSVGRDWGDYAIRRSDGSFLIGPDWEVEIFTSRQAAENRIKNDYTLLYEGAVPVLYSSNTR